MSHLAELEEIGRDLARAENYFQEIAARLHGSQDAFERRALESRLEERRRIVERYRSEYELCKSRLKP